MTPISASDHKAQLAALPGLPGVYRYFDALGACLYVGKARDLKRRVSSYFLKTDHSPRIALMVHKIAAMEITVVRSEVEALLLEHNLIKALSPRYNIVFRDDKSYPYLKISADEFPRVSFYRGAVDRRSRYFGPFPNSGSVREAISVLQKTFGLRTCEEGVYRNRSRACLMGQMGRCSAPCVGAVSAEQYARDIAGALAFLEGRTDSLLEEFRTRMLEASEKREYERAAFFRDRITALSNVARQQAVETTGGDTNADIIAVAIR